MSEVVITVQNTTPLLTGWYEPRLVDPVGLRATEIKGLWRWWARAFVGGVLYDLGYLEERSPDIIYLRPTRKEVSMISSIVGKNLGLGYAGKNETYPSQLKIYIEPLNHVPIWTINREGEHSHVEPDYTQYGRIELLKRKRRRKVEKEAERGKEEKIELIPPEKGKFNIHIRTVAPIDQSHALTAIKILLVGLQMMGIGKGARRGLGSLDVLKVGDLKITKDLSKLIKETYNEVKDIVKKSNIVVGRSGRQGPHVSSNLPPLPVISMDKNMYITQIYHIPQLQPSEFVQIHNFFLKANRLTVLGSDNLSQQHKEWVLGLPRRIAKDTIKVRRASPFTMSFHTKQNHFGEGAYVAVFLSGDWPTEIARYLNYQRQKPTSTHRENPIVKALATAVEEFKSYTYNVTGSEPTLIWPT